MTPPKWWYRLKPEAIWGTTRLLNEVGGLRVTSGWRSVLANLKARGVKGSGHVLGWCTDMVGDRPTMNRAASVARAWGCRQVLIHDVGSGMHLHVDWRGARF